MAGIDVDASFYNNTKGILRDLQAKRGGNRADSRLLGSVEFIVGGEEFIESGELVSIHHFCLLYSIFPLTVHHLYLLYSIRSSNDGMYYIGERCRRIGSY
jgi:hypothetical protein